MEELYGEQKLQDIASMVIDGYNQDSDSVQGYVEENQMWERVALQHREEKNYPWPKSSNVKNPMLTVACGQFGARAYPSLVPGIEVVKYKVSHLTSDNKAASDRGLRIARYMDYQLLEDMEDWETDMDVMLSAHLPGVGTAFKKTYFDPITNKCVSELIPYDELVIDYYAASLDRAHRVTHKLWYLNHEIESKIRNGVYSPVDYGSPSTKREQPVREDVSKQHPAGSDDKAVPHLILECHTWYDLDGDGMEEPWICVVHYDSGKLLAMYPRFDRELAKMDDQGNITHLPTVQYFTNYQFIPNPHSKIYGLGFYKLLGPLVESINSITNMLINAGHLHSLQAGFISKNFKLKAGVISFTPGQFHTVPSMGEDISRGIFALPTKEPSNVLFMLLGAIQQDANNVASIKDILLGENPGQNTKVGTVQATIEQGLKTYTSIFKRIHRAFKKELKLIYRLNHLFLDEERYFSVLGTGQEEKIGKEDFKDTISVIPVSDPNVATDTQRRAKAEALMPFVQIGTVNPQEATRRILEAQQQENVEALMTMPQPQPGFEQQIEMQKLQLENKKLEQDFAIKQQELKIRTIEALGRIEQNERQSAIASADSIVDEILRKQELEIKKSEVARRDKSGETQ